MIVYDEYSTINDEDIKKISKAIDKANRKRRKDIIFWQIIGCKLFGHQKDYKKTHMIVTPGIICWRCFRWISN